jgi:hypothetical protein
VGADFVDARKLLMPMTFARGAPDGGLGMTNPFFPLQLSGSHD